MSGCLLLVLAGSGLFAWKLETPIHETLIQTELGLKLDGADWWICFLAVWGKTLWLALPILVVSVTACLTGRFRLSAIVFNLSVAGLAYWLVMDLYLMTLTRTHVIDYVGFAFDRSAWEWAGQSSRVLSRLALLFVAVLCSVMMVCCPVAILMRRTADHVQLSGMKRLAVSLVAMYAIVLAGSAASLGWAEGTSHSFMPSLCAQFPVRFSNTVDVDGDSTTDARVSSLRESFQAAYADAFPDLIVGHELDDSIRIPEANRANVVIFVLESLRHDALTPETMPMLCRLADRGLLCERHYAGANASHFGLFSLLYGRSALVYDPTLDAGVPPQLCATLRESGYELSFVSSASCDEWFRMGDFLNDAVFDRVETFGVGSWVDRDRATLGRVAKILTDADRSQPQLIVAYLMSTHTSYEFPPEFAIHEPYADDVDLNLFTLGQREGLWNRYRNAAGFLDHEVAHTIGQIDLNRAVVVVTGDHGESLLDDGHMFHSSRLSEIQTRVPCLVLGAGIPRVPVATMTSHVDIMPTLVDALRGSPTLIVHAHGQSLLRGSPQDGVLLVQPATVAQHDLPYRDAAIVTVDLRAKIRLSRHEPDVLDVKLIDERGHTRSSNAVTDQGLSDLETAFRNQMSALQNGAEGMQTDSMMRGGGGGLSALRNRR